MIENNGSTEEAVASLLHDILENENGKKKIASIKSKIWNKGFKYNQTMLK